MLTFRKSIGITACYLKQLRQPARLLDLKFLSTEQYSNKNGPLSSISIPFSKELKTELNTEHSKLIKVFPDFVSELTEIIASFYNQDIANHYKRALEYNVPTGLNNRALIMILTYKNIVDEANQTNAKTHLVRLLAWCAELIHGSFIITDDIVDRSNIRRNKPCWYKLKNVGWQAVNDAILIENSVYIILKKYFLNIPNYVDLIELFRETTYMTALGQTIDCDSAHKGIEHFSIRAHKYASFYKNAHLGFYAPIAASMIFCGKSDQKVLNRIKAICFEMGYFYQSQNDYFDFFSQTVLRKPGTDIEDGRCTWLAITAMERATPAQKKILAESYGRKDVECIQKVRQIYEEMDFPLLFEKYRNDCYQSIHSQIQMANENIPRIILQHTLDLTISHNCQ